MTSRKPIRAALAASLLITLHPLTAGAAQPEPGSSDCIGWLADAEGSLQNARALGNQKRWDEAISAYRDARASADKAQACSSEAARQQNISATAASELQKAEASAQHQNTCQPSLDQALDYDIRATSARREGRDSADIEKLLAEAENHWRRAVASCQLPYRDKAERSLNATIKARAVNAELLSGGPACDAAWKSANALGDLARAAWKDKHWDEAAALHQKAALAWETAGEKCVGSRQQQALRKAEQSQVDAYNAEHCAPQWDTASELTQLFRTVGPSRPLVERDQMSIQAEVAWRNAAALCHGNPQNQAQLTADGMARERGAPLPPNAAQLVRKSPALTASAAATNTTGAPSSATSGNAGTVTASAAPSAAPSAATSGTATSTPSATSPGTASATPSSTAVMANAASASKTNLTGTAQASTAPLATEDRTVDDTTYHGFRFDNRTGFATGTGVITWTNGDRFEGTLVDGKRQGKGKFTWQNGQWYDGEWRDDVATGQGTIAYPNGNRYEGQVANGIPQGRGTLYFASGDRYAGLFDNAEFHGQGSYFWKSGGRYDGAWARGVKHGHGKLLQPSGDGWEGEFADDDETDNGQPIVATGTTKPSTATLQAAARKKGR